MNNLALNHMPSRRMLSVSSPEEASSEPPSQERVDRLMRRVSQSRTALTVWVPFFGYLLLKLNPRVATPRDGVPTAAVCRDRTLILNVDFCEKLSDAELVGLLCHEVCHPAFLCFERMGGRTAMVVSKTGVVTLWNVAHDFAINLIIDDMCSPVRDKVTLPPNPCLDQKYRDMSAEEIYDDIIDEAKKNGPSKDGEGGIMIPGGKDGEPGGGEWGMDDLRPDQGDSADGEKAAKGSESAQKELDSYWKVAVVEAAQIHEREKGRGSLPAGLQKLIDEITNPAVSWVDVLSRWVGENGRRADFTYRRPSRRSEAVGEFLPSMQRHGVDDLWILWDTSGSMNGREAEVFSEIIGICDDMNMSLRVTCCDMGICSDQHDVQEPEDVDVRGGGGSDFNPAFDLIEEEGYTGVVIAFTDGYIGVPAVKPPQLRDCLWVLWDAHGDTDPTGGKWGEVLRVDEEGNAV